MASGSSACCIPVLLRRSLGENSTRHSFWMHLQAFRCAWWMVEDMFEARNMGQCRASVLQEYPRFQKPILFVTSLPFCRLFFGFSYSTLTVLPSVRMRLWCQIPNFLSICRWNHPFTVLLHHVFSWHPDFLTKCLIDEVSELGCHG